MLLAEETTTEYSSVYRPFLGEIKKKIMHYLLDIWCEYVTIYIWLIKEKI